VKPISTARLSAARFRWGAMLLSDRPLAYPGHSAEHDAPVNDDWRNLQVPWVAGAADASVLTSLTWLRGDGLTGPVDDPGIAPPVRRAHH
jgi:hypothetical protein